MRRWKHPPPTDPDAKVGTGGTPRLWRGPGAAAFGPAVGGIKDGTTLTLTLITASFAELRTSLDGVGVLDATR
ncbi:MAG: hypothetical protein JSU77_03960 [Fidelibacterota bacterium]|nr:MAG: hypothetical protein JSU77_03960 [Candidatus Neomarinimicrobiota bacterium]